MQDLKLAILIDADNISPKYVKVILDEAASFGVATAKRIYGDWSDVRLKSWKDQLLNLRIAFEELNLEKIYLYLFEMNHRAEAFYKKCGFVYEATFVRHMVLNGELQNIKWYRMLKEEWKQKF